MSAIWRSIQEFFASGLDLLHGVFEPVFGVHAWGWAIIALTLIVRVAMLPLARKQFTSMRAMQELSPEVKRIQKKYKTDRDLMKKDPQRYQAIKAKQNEELQALYREHGVNPAAGCLPLLAQAPIFLALFSVLRSQDILDGQIVTAPFYFFTSGASPVDGFDVPGLGSAASSAGIPGYLLILAMAGTMFFTTRQTMARTAKARETTKSRDDDGPDLQAQQQKIMMYVMPPFLAIISFNFPLGVLLYWVTTNFWQVAQQALILREVKDTTDAAPSENAKGVKTSGSSTKKTSSKPKGSSRPTPSKSDTAGRSSRDDLRKHKKGGHLPAARGKGGANRHLPSRKQS